MAGFHGLQRSRRLTAIAFALYAVFLVTAEFEHHDLACHFKTPQHCTSCASSPLSAAPHAPVAADAHRLADAGRAYSFARLLHGAVLTAHASGRSPPVIAAV
jgi:hypothetical protein